MLIWSSYHSSFSRMLGLLHGTFYLVDCLGLLNSILHLIDIIFILWIKTVTHIFWTEIIKWKQDFSYFLFIFFLRIQFQFWNHVFDFNFFFKKNGVTNTTIILYFFYFGGKCFLHFSMFGTMENARLLHGPPATY